MSKIRINGTTIFTIDNAYDLVTDAISATDQVANVSSKLFKYGIAMHSTNNI